MMIRRLLASALLGLLAFPSLGVAQGSVEFLRLTCIEATGFLEVAYVDMPQDAVDGSGSGSADAASLKAWRQKNRPEWAKFGFLDPDKLSLTCNFGNSEYRVTSMRMPSLPRKCDDGPIAVTVSNHGKTYIENLILGPSCGDGPSLRSMEIWNGLGKPPQDMRLCLYFQSSPQWETSCYDYNPRQGDYGLLPAITQSDFSTFVIGNSARRMTSATAASGFSRDFSSLARFMEFRLPCKFTPDLVLADDVIVYAVGGGKSENLPFRFDEYPNSYKIDVVVNAPGKKVALLFIGYEQNIWNIRWTTGTTIVSAASFGGGVQVFAGLPQATPKFSGHYGSGFACKEHVSGFTRYSPDDLRKINAMSRAIYGRPADRIFGGRYGDFVVGEELQHGAALVQSPETPVGSFSGASGRSVSR